jgi:hypothetical protein
MFITRLMFLFSAIFVVLPLLCQPTFASQVELSDNEKKSSAYLLSHTKPNKTYKLNLSEANQKRHVLRTLAKAGKTAENSPQLFKVLNATIKKHQAQARRKGASASTPTRIAASSNAAPQDLNTIINFKVTAPATKSYSATAISSVVGGTNTSIVTVKITSPDGLTVYGTNTQSQMAKGTKLLVTATATNVPSDVTPVTSATFVYIPTTSSDTTVSATASAVLMQPAGGNSTMTEPNYCTDWEGTKCNVYAKTPINTGETTLTAITYCYGEDFTSPIQCDYGAEPSPDFAMKIEGTATFITPIKLPISGSWSAQVVYPEKESCILQYIGGMNDNDLYMPKLNTPWTIDPYDPKKLNWNIPFVLLTSPTSPTSPEDCLSYTDGKKLSFLFQGSVDLTGKGTNAKGTFQFTSSNSQTGQGIFIIPELELRERSSKKD